MSERKHLRATEDKQVIPTLKRTEGELAEQSTLLETILENMAQGFAVYDADQKLIAYNNQYIEMGGYSPGFIHLGIDRQEVLKFIAKRDNYGKDDFDKLVKEQVKKAIASAQSGEDRTNETTTSSNGKVYLYQRRSMPDGSLVSTFTDITERKKAEQEIAEKSILLETALESMPHGFMIFDADHKLVAFNHRIKDIFDFASDFLRLGISHEEIIRCRVEKGFHGEGDVEELVKRLHARALDPAPRTHETTYPNGKVYIFNRKPMPDGFYVNTFTEITERKKVEQEFERQSVLLQTSLETMAQGFIVYDADMKVTTFNHRYIEILEFPSDCLKIGMTYEEVVRIRAQKGDYGDVSIEEAVNFRLDNIKPQTESSDERSLPNGKIYAYYRKPMPDGGFVITYTDITRLKLALDALQESEKIARILFNSNPIPQILWEKSGGEFIQLDHNKAASVRSDGALDQNRNSKAKEEFWCWPEGLRLLKKCLSQQRTQFHSSERPKLLTGEMRWTDTTFVFIPPNRVMVHAQDIHERKQAEEQIKASLAEKEVLLREIHHRVKNNLQVISSLLSLQARAETDEHTHQALEISQRRVRVMARIHENLHQSDDLASINARDFINNVVKDTIESSGHDGQSISSHIDVDDIDISMDQAIPCGQIVSELLSNSLKHAFPNGKSGNIEISLHRRDGDRIELTVADDGKGLPEDFDLEQTQTLGMQLVHALSNQLRGELKIGGTTGTRIQIAFPEQPI